ncbi:hypothetical protein KUTeg_009556 [Tegillarca granosa]|uniref:Uncharacterized protein n=1 Tax=Tegillarca granosa TaxID=220873 RepID=A0ABQ9F490_TEGGR|nr:hypothetical protein KUTeg_009556 [Tegillarca granosa]
MTINIPGLVVLFVFYAAIFVAGVFISYRKKRTQAGKSSLESSVVAGREISGVVGIFTMTATTVGGGYINGTAESIATAGMYVRSKFNEASLTTGKTVVGFWKMLFP